MHLIIGSNELPPAQQNYFYMLRVDVTFTNRAVDNGYKLMSNYWFVNGVDFIVDWVIMIYNNIYFVPIIRGSTIHWPFTFSLFTPCSKNSNLKLSVNVQIYWWIRCECKEHETTFTLFMIDMSYRLKQYNCHIKSLNSHG